MNVAILTVRKLTSDFGFLYCMFKSVASTAAILWGDERTSVPKDTESRGGEEWGGIALSREGVSPSGPPPANYVYADNRKLYILQ